MAEITVTGHTPADTDSICSPLAYAWHLKNVKGLDAQAVMSGPLNKEPQFVLQYFGVDAPAQLTEVTPKDRFVIIDTSNPQELFPGIIDAEIIEVIDHHKLSGLTTARPLVMTVRPYGCVATVVYELMGDAGVRLPREIAGLLLAGIISDTLNLTGPTTTDNDRNVAAKLSELAGVNMDELAEGMFAAKSDVSDLSGADLVVMDYKVFKFGGQDYGISAIETVKPDLVLARAAELRQAAEGKKAADNLAGVFVFIVDIINQHANVISTSGAEADLAAKAFQKEWVNGKMDLPGIVSRKKQIVPAFEAVA